MATHGSVSAYDPSAEDWTTYTQRLHHYFVANDVESEVKKSSILLSACGAATYKLIRNLIAEDKLESTPYDEIVKVVKAHYDPTPSAIMQRYKFNSRTRGEGESVSAYVTALRDIAQHCNYKDSLQDMLRDKLVHGVRHERITNRLLAEKTLTYEKALELALAIESAERDTNQLRLLPKCITVHPLEGDEAKTGDRLGRELSSLATDVEADTHQNSVDSKHCLSWMQKTWTYGTSLSIYAQWKCGTKDARKESSLP